MISLVNGMFWPYGQPPAFSATTATALDAANEYVAFIGRLSIEGKATGKTLDTTGSSKVLFYTGTSSVFAHANSRLRAGIQGVDNSVLPVRPDGTWKVYAEASTSDDFSPALATDTSGVSKTPNYYDGSSTFSHGDLVAFVCQLTVQGSADSVTVANGAALGTSSGAASFPCAVTNISGSVAAISGGVPACSIVFSDGTLGYIDRGNVGLAIANTWDSANNPSERGEIFQVPFGVTIDALMCAMRVADGGADFSIALYSDPTGTPVEEIAPITITAETLAATGTEGSFTYTLASDFTLLANTDYCLIVKALGTGTGDNRFNVATIGHADQRELLWPAGATAKGATRNGGTGAFNTSDTTHYPVGVRISSIDTGAGGGIRMAGHGGLAA